MVSEETLQQIEDFFSDEMSDTERNELLSKVESSDEVRARFEESRKLWSFMESAETIEPEPDYIRKFWKKVSDEEGEKDKVLFPFQFHEQEAGICYFTCSISIAKHNNGK